jgi:hypothetical protein
VTRSPKILVPVAILGALAAAGWFLLIQPKREEAARVGAKVSLAQADLANLQAKAADHAKARESYPVNVATVTRLGKAVPTDDDMGSLMVQLDSATRRSGVDFTAIELNQDSAGTASGQSADTRPKTVSPGSTVPGAVAVPGSGVSSMPFAFSFQGDFFGLSSFLARLQRFVTLRGDRIAVNGRLLRVESVSLKIGDKGFPRIRAQVKASSFLAPQQATRANGAGAAGATPAGAAGVGSATTQATTNANVPGAVR